MGVYVARVGKTTLFPPQFSQITQFISICMQNLYFISQKEEASFVDILANTYIYTRNLYLRLVMVPKLKR